MKQDVTTMHSLYCSRGNIQHMYILKRQNQSVIRESPLKYAFKLIVHKFTELRLAKRQKEGVGAANRKL